MTIVIVNALKSHVGGSFTLHGTPSTVQLLLTLLMQLRKAFQHKRMSEESWLPNYYPI